VISTAGS